MTIDENVVVLLSVLMIVSFMLAIICVAVWKICAKGPLTPFFGGIFVYAVFTMSIRGLLDLLFGLTGMQNNVVYAIYNTITWAALLPFARFMGFRVLHRDRKEGNNAVSFALGTAAAELIMLFGLSAVTYYSYAVAFSDPEALKQLGQMSAEDAKMIEQVKEYLTSLTVMNCVLSIVECVSRLVLQVALAVPMFAFVHGKGDRNMVWITVALQFTALLPLHLYQAGVGVPQWCAEAVLLAVAVGASVYAYSIYQTLPKPKSYEANFRHL